MGAMRRVLEWGMNRRSFVRVEEDSTRGATVGKNLYNEDGTLFDPETVVTEIVEEIEAPGATPGFAYTVWRFIREIPANILSLADLSGIGFATRISAAGEWANRTITGIGRITVVSGDGVGTNLVTLNTGVNVTLNDGNFVTLNSGLTGDPIISLEDPNYVAVTAAYDVLFDDDTVDAISGTFEITLLTAVGRVGKIYNLKNSGTGVITLVNVLSETIDDNASSTLKLVQYENLQVQSNGANWIIL